MLPNYVFVNYNSKLDSDEPESGFEMLLSKPLQCIHGEVTKVTFSNIIIEFHSITDVSRVLVVKNRDLILQNHDSNGQGPVLFCAVPGTSGNEAVDAEEGSDAVLSTHHAAPVDEVCVYALVPLGLHRLMFDFHDTSGDAFENVKSFSAIMKFE